MQFTYEILINLNTRNKFFTDTVDVLRADPFVFTYRGTVEADTILKAAWAVVAIHNRDDRPDGQIGPSFSVGDAIDLHSNPSWSEVQTLATFYSVRGDLVPADYPDHVERRRSWLEMV